MFKLKTLIALATTAIAPLAYAVSSQTYTWKNVKIGGGGGFVPSIVFNPSNYYYPFCIGIMLIYWITAEKGLAYARTDIGGAYKLNADDTWTPLLDFADNARWDYWGTDALATDPVDTNRLYLVCLEKSYLETLIAIDVYA